MFNAFLKLLAVDRLVRLVVTDEITAPFRDGVIRRWPQSKIAYMVSCKACVSVWAGLLVASGKLPRWVQSALAASAMVLILDRQDERLGVLTSLATAHRRKVERGINTR